MLLAMLAPTMRAVAGRFTRHLPYGVDEAELKQEIVSDVLSVATVLPLRDPARLTRIRFEGRVARLVRRWLQKIEREQQHERVDDLDVVDVQGEAGLEGVLDRAAVSPEVITPADLALAYRSRVLGRTLADLARAEGCTVGVIRGRLRRVMSRLTVLYPDAFERRLAEVTEAA